LKLHWLVLSWLRRDRRREPKKAEKRAITLGIPAKELETRLRKWTQPKPNYRRGVLAKYATLVSSASEGAVTDAGL
jgi:dihydroxy-acid dehydratase